DNGQQLLRQRAVGVPIDLPCNGSPTDCQSSRSSCTRTRRAERSQTNCHQRPVLTSADQARPRQPVKVQPPIFLFDISVPIRSSLISSMSYRRGSQIVSDKKTYDKTAGIQREILPASSNQGRWPSEMRKVRQGNGGFNAWIMSRVQEDPR